MLLITWCNSTDLWFQRQLAIVNAICMFCYLLRFIHYYTVGVCVGFQNISLWSWRLHTYLRWVTSLLTSGIVLARDSLVGDNHPRKQNDITLWITQNSESIIKMLCRLKLHSNWGSALTVWNASKCLNSNSREGMLVSGDFQIFRRQRSKKKLSQLPQQHL